MSAFGRAGALSLGLHVAVVFGAYFGLGTPLPVGAVTRGGKFTQDVGVVALAEPERKPVPAPPQPPRPAPLPQPLTTEQSPLPVPPPLPRSMLVTLPPDVRPAAHAESATAVTRPAAAAQVPGPVTPTFFSVRAVGKSVVYVIDRSSSMGIDGRFDRAREQVIASLRQLPADVRFQVITYDRNAFALHVGESGLAVATPANVNAAAAELTMMSPEGATDHVRALQRALSLGPDVIYFLTDEDDLTPSDVRRITQLNTRHVSIHALCLVPPSTANTPMWNLARQNRGIFQVVH